MVSPSPASRAPPSPGSRRADPSRNPRVASQSARRSPDKTARTRPNAQPPRRGPHAAAAPGGSHARGGSAQPELDDLSEGEGRDARAGGRASSERRAFPGPHNPRADPTVPVRRGEGRQAGASASSRRDSLSAPTHRTSEQGGREDAKNDGNQRPAQGSAAHRAGARSAAHRNRASLAFEEPALFSAAGEVAHVPLGDPDASDPRKSKSSLVKALGVGKSAADLHAEDLRLVSSGLLFEPKFGDLSLDSVSISPTRSFEFPATGAGRGGGGGAHARDATASTAAAGFDDTYLADDGEDHAVFAPAQSHVDHILAAARERARAQLQAASGVASARNGTRAESAPRRVRAAELGSGPRLHATGQDEHTEEGTLPAGPYEVKSEARHERPQSSRAKPFSAGGSVKQVPVSHTTHSTFDRLGAPRSKQSGYYQAPVHSLSAITRR